MLRLRRRLHLEVVVHPGYARDPAGGIGRLRDAGFPPVWGPGRHGPGNNVFGYFIGPHGGVIEYTAEVEEIGDDYPVGGPEKWKWPQGRTDHWGVSARDDKRIHAAERAYTWA